MRFELDEILINEILFCMENQDGKFVFDISKNHIAEIDSDLTEQDFDDENLFIPLPEWKSHDGYRLMEKFGAELKNPVARHELTAALNRNKGVFRSFKNVLEQYPEVEKMWLRFKEQKMKEEIIAWYNALRERWNLEPIGMEPEDNSSIVMEDFILREGKKGDMEDAALLHRICVEEAANKDLSNPLIFPGDLCFVAENASSDFCGFISAVNDALSHLRICQLEIKHEYRGLGLGKTLLSKLLEKAESQKSTITIELPESMDFFSRALHMENFKPASKRFIRK